MISRVGHILRRAGRAWRSVSGPIPPQPDPVALEAQRIKPLAWRQFDVYANLRELAGQYADLGVGNDLSRFERKVFSQNGEDGVICEILERLGPRTRRFVEIGVGDGTESNCLFLADVLGWSGVFVEAGAVEAEELARRYRGNPGISLVARAVTPENVNELLKPYAADGVDVLSIDIDGNDYYIWEAISVIQPQLVVVEYNAGLGPERPLVQRYDPGSAWDRSGRYGASIGALRRLAGRKGYRLVYTDLTGSNAFFVLEDVAERVGAEAPVRAANFWLNGEHHRPEANPEDFVDLDAP